MIDIEKFYKYGGKYIVLFLIFNLIFIGGAIGVKFAAPFILSFFLAIWLKPLTSLIYKKTKINESLINTVCIIGSIVALIMLCILVGAGIFKETANLLSELSHIDFNGIYDKFTSAKEYIESVSPETINAIITYMQGIAGNLASYIGLVANWIIKAATLIPTGIINLIIIILSTFYMLKDYDKFKDYFDNISTPGNGVPKKLACKAVDIITGYIRSYGVLLSLTFIECIAVFYIFDVKYMFTLAIVCVILDILPIVGSAMIYIPIAITFAIKGDMVTCIWILGLYAAFMVIRNIIEPKLLSKTMSIHPILILMSIYIGLALGGIIGVIYCIFLIAYVKLLAEAEVL